MHIIEELIDIILSKSEKLEDEIKQQSDLKNLTLKQLNCIEFVNEMDNPSLSEIAIKLETTRPSTTVMIDRLEEHGYLIKVKSDSDRRSAHVHLTEKGIRASELHAEAHTKFAKQLTKDLTESETEMLVVLLNKAINSL